MLRERSFELPATLIATVLAAGLCAGTLVAQSGQNSNTSLATGTSPAAVGQSSTPAARPSGATATSAHYEPNRLARRAEMYYAGVWGVDSFNVKTAESGELIRFTWRVTDPEKAKALHDKKLEPFLEDAQAGVKLVVPQMEKVGSLRQSSTPEAGKSYWMAFSNVGRRVKR